MKFFNRLRTRLLLIMALAMVPLLVQRIGGFLQERAMLEAMTEQRIRNQLAMALVPESIVLDNMRQVLRIMAYAEDLRDLAPNQCIDLAWRLLHSQQNFVNIGAAALDGKVFCSGIPAGLLGNVSDQAWFAQALARRDFSDGQIVVDPVSGQRRLMFGYPLLNAHGKPRAILFGALSLDWIERLAKAAPVDAGWVVVVHGIDGHIIARYPDPEGLRGKTLTNHELIRFIQTRPGLAVRELTGAAGVRRLYGIAPLASANGEIYLAVGAPSESIFADINTRLQHSLLLTVLVGLASFLLAWLAINRQFVGFSSRLGQAMRRVGEGERGLRIEPASDVLELQGIETGFNRMMQQIDALDAQHRTDTAALRELNTILDAVINSSGAMIYAFDIEGRCLLASQSFAQLVGRTQQQMQGCTREDFLPPDLAREQRDNDRRVIETGAVLTLEEEITLPGKPTQTYLAMKFPLHDERGKLYAVGGISTNITERKAIDQQLQKLLNYDALTGLPNRTLFLDRLSQALYAAERQRRGIAVFCVDLARFRILNDTFGHATGDRVLTEAGQRIAQAARTGDSVARLSADEFGVLMAGFDRDSDIDLLAQRVLDSLAQTLSIDGKDYSLAANIGISLYARDGSSAEDLLKAAEVALVRAKDAGHNTFRFFTAGMNIAAERRLRLEAELRGALAQGQLELHYQPQIDLATGRICGIEALMRWTHPQLGSIAPVEFIPIAEEAALIQPIGAWALREACRQNKAWLDAGLPPLPVAVNISGRQLCQPELVELIAEVLAATGLPPALLELELTEMAFTGKAVEIAATVRRISELGVLLALDDFGIGYSSLAFLSGFPFNKIKIDQSFVQDITTNPVNVAITTATIAMARSLNLVVLAEGVETDAQMNFLRTRQCEAMQGFLFSKALPAAELTALLSSGRQLKVSANETAPKQTLLLVDDEPNILSALKRLLRRDGYEILTAESPQAAFELLAQHEVQVIVSDQRMPEMSGTEFLERAKLLYPNTVRIILSGYTDLDSITEAINRGAIYHFLTKPWDDDKLRAQVREAFRVAQGFARA